MPIEQLQRTKFTVRGGGPFPIDMLRYDGCHPASESDSARIENSDGRGQRDVTLVGHTDPDRTYPSRERWESFTWKVVKVHEDTDGRI